MKIHVKSLRRHQKEKKKERETGERLAVRDLFLEFSLDQMGTYTQTHALN